MQVSLGELGTSYFLLAKNAFVNIGDKSCPSLRAKICQTSVCKQKKLSLNNKRLLVEKKIVKLLKKRGL